MSFAIPELIALLYNLYFCLEYRLILALAHTFGCHFGWNWYYRSWCKMEKILELAIKGRFYVTTSLSDSWEAFIPLRAGVTLGKFLH